MDWNENVKCYLETVALGIPEADRPKRCLRCGQTHRMTHRHDHFTRTVFTLGYPDGIEIPIFRFYCPFCKKTFSIIPTFVEKHHQTALDIKEEVIQCHEAGTGFPEVAKRTAMLPGGRYSAKTIWRWTKRWNERLTKLQPKIWNWLLSRFPHLHFPKGGDGSLWLILLKLWTQIQQEMIDWRRIRFLHFLNCLSLPIAVTVGPNHPIKNVHH
jgi:transposase-like protein